MSATTRTRCLLVAVQLNDLVSWHTDFMSISRPPAAVVGTTVAAAGACQVLAGFTGQPSVWQLSWLVATTLLAGVAGWWAVAADVDEIKKNSVNGYRPTVDELLAAAHATASKKILKVSKMGVFDTSD